MELKVSLGTGKNTSGCRSCGEVFTSGSGFDKHWIGWVKRGGKCQHPSKVGLVQRDDGKWHFPARDDDISLREIGALKAARDTP